MRIAAIASFAVAVTLSTLAAAQQTLPPECATFTPAPAIPDGATADNSDMREARAALEAWRTTRRAELSACEAASRALDQRAQAAMSAHNAAATETEELVERFATENQEYTARGGQSRRDRPSTRPNGR